LAWALLYIKANTNEGRNKMRHPIEIEYKTKIKEMEGGRKYIDYKKTLKRNDCNNSMHPYYNSDLFLNILNRKYNEVLQGKRWNYVDEMPSCFTVIDGGFLATIRATI
jgi:hypothetical protein